MDCSPPDSSVHGILQARILEWVAMPFSRGSSPPRDQIQVSCIAGTFFFFFNHLSHQGDPIRHGANRYFLGWDVALSEQGSSFSVKLLPGTRALAEACLLASFVQQDTKTEDTIVRWLTLHTHYVFRNIEVISWSSSPRASTSSEMGLIHSVLIWKLCQKHILLKWKY